MITPSVSVIVSLTDKLTAPLRAVSDRVGALAARMNRALDPRGMANVAAGSRRVAAGLGDVIRQSKGAALALAGYTSALAAMSFKFVGPAAEMERFKVQLTNLEGGADGAEKALAWIQEFATRTPLELNDTVAAYARLKAFGLDPTNGSLQALVDTMAATGGGAEQLDGLVLALGQAWTKGKLQGEEALQMLERGVPVWDLLAAKMGKTGAEVQELATKGKLGRKELTLLIDALAERNKGASGNMAKTWDGIISNLMDHWARFQIMVMDSGVFDYLKSRLQQFLALLDQMSADGRLKMWADRLAGAMLTALKTIWEFGEGALALWRAWEPVLSRGAELMGGWRNVAIALFAVMSGKMLLGIAGSLIGIVTGVGQVAAGLAAISVGPLTALGKAAIFLSSVGLRRLVGALSVVRFAVISVGRAMLANPIGLAAAAIAGAAYLVYRNWDRVGPWFRRLFGNMMKISRGLIQFFRGVFTGDMSGAVDGLKRVWGGLRGWYGTLWAGIKGIFSWAWSSGIKPITDKLGITEPITAAWDTARALLDATLTAIGSVFSTVWDNYIKPAIDGLFSIQGVGAVWEGIKDAIGAVLDWLAEKFQAAWAMISPVIDGLKWAKDKGAEAVAAISGATSFEPYKGGVTDARGASVAGSILNRPPGVPARAQGGTFAPGPVLVGERGPELRYESRGGFIANHNALRGLIALSARARQLAAGLGSAHPPFGQAITALAVRAQASTSRELSQAVIPSPAIQTIGAVARPIDRPVHYAPVFNISIDGSGHDLPGLRRMVRAELDAANRKAASDMRRLQHD